MSERERGLRRGRRRERERESARAREGEEGGEGETERGRDSVNFSKIYTESEKSRNKEPYARVKTEA